MDGYVQLVVQADPDRQAIMRCVNDALSQSAALAGSPGRLAMHAPAARAAVRISEGAVLVPVSVNGIDATFLLDARTPFTVVRPALAQRAGIEPSMFSSRLRATFEGEPATVPLVRLRSLKVDNATVEGIDVAIHQLLPKRDDIDGLLGRNFLQHFKVTVDHQGRALLLEPAATSK